MKLVVVIFALTVTSLTVFERKTAQLDENPPGQRESKHIKTENDSDDDWVWDFDLDKVINAYQI
jgi:hypothetical protein